MSGRKSPATPSTVWISTSPIELSRGVSRKLEPLRCASGARPTPMSAYGTKQTLLPGLGMSALGGEADISVPRSNVR